MSDNNYIVAAQKSWHREVFDSKVSKFKGVWHYISSEEELTEEFLQKVNPKYIFFPHWSSKIPDNIITKYECVCFHETDLPYGRGGSPIQNLIVRGHKETVISALKMTSEFDAGPIYLKIPLSLAGSAQQIFERSAEIMAEMMKIIIETNPLPIEQVGDGTIFKRRKPEESQLPKEAPDLSTIYDHIRMLDAETYPKAFIDWGNMRIEFRDVEENGSDLTAKVKISYKK